jgi:hypothetical protein
MGTGRVEEETHHSRRTRCHVEQKLQIPAGIIETVASL